MADITVKPARDPEAQRRNRRAWENFAHPETDQCRYCPHDRYDHIGRSAAAAEFGTQLGESQSTEYALTRLFCLACAEELDTEQVVCYRLAGRDE